jgi:ketosteroid isomerase-like protein
MIQTDSPTRAQIDRTNGAFAEAFRRGNGAGLGAVYSADAAILPPNAEPRRGKPEIQAFWQSALDMGVAAADLETVEFEEMGDTAWEVGKFSLKAKDGRLLDHGKYIVIWKREHGAWKWHRDIWNSSRPAQP